MPEQGEGQQPWVEVAWASRSQGVQAHAAIRPGHPPMINANTTTQKNFDFILSLYQQVEKPSSQRS